MDDEWLLRYSRQIMLPGIDVEGQQRLNGSHVLLIGVGGLGSPVAMYLAASGIGRLTLVDDDVVDLSNLQRQIVHTTERVGESKVSSAQRTLAALNPNVEVCTIQQRLTGEALVDAVAAADVVVDATDNFSIRFALNRASIATLTPLVSGAAIRMEGQVSVFQPAVSDSPCYRCVYPDTGEELGERCADSGVLGSVVGLIGCVQATETVKLLTGLGEALTGRMLVLDARTMRWLDLKVTRDPHCPDCANRSATPQA